jgi:hypothetical protein
MDHDDAEVLAGIRRNLAARGEPDDLSDAELRLVLRITLQAMALLYGSEEKPPAGQTKS